MPDTVLPTEDRETVQKGSLLLSFCLFVERGCAGGTLYLATPPSFTLCCTPLKMLISSTPSIQAVISQLDYYKPPRVCCLFSITKVTYCTPDHISLLFKNFSLLGKNANSLPMVSKAQCDLVCCYTFSLIPTSLSFTHYTLVTDCLEVP